MAGSALELSRDSEEGDMRWMALPRSASAGLGPWIVTGATAIAASWTPAGVAAPPPRQALDPRGAPVERWLDPVPVSGSLRVGLMAAGGPGNRLPSPPRPIADRLEFEVFLGVPSAGPLCVEISSRDGHYEAHATYDPIPGARGWLSLRLRSQHADRLARLGEEVVVILASLAAGADCDRLDGPFLPARWLDAGSRREPAPDPPPGGVLYLNSRVPTRLVAADLRGGITAEIPCEALDGATTAFNLRCPLPGEWFTQPPARLLIRKRERRGSTLRFVDVPLALAAASAAHGGDRP